MYQPIVEAGKHFMYARITYLNLFQEAAVAERITVEVDFISTECESSLKDII